MIEAVVTCVWEMVEWSQDECALGELWLGATCSYFHELFQIIVINVTRARSTCCCPVSDSFPAAELGRSSAALMSQLQK